MKVKMLHITDELDIALKRAAHLNFSSASKFIRVSLYDSLMKLNDDQISSILKNELEREARRKPGRPVD